MSQQNMRMHVLGALILVLIVNVYAEGPVGPAGPNNAQQNQGNQQALQRQYAQNRNQFNPLNPQFQPARMKQLGREGAPTHPDGGSAPSLSYRRHQRYDEDFDYAYDNYRYGSNCGRRRRYYY
jgi:hypothetical protein